MKPRGSVTSLTMLPRPVRERSARSIALVVTITGKRTEQDESSKRVSLMLTCKKLVDIAMVSFLAKRTSLPFPTAPQ